MQFLPTEIREVVEIVPVRHGDARGFFSETWKRSAFEDAGLAHDWVQDNQSLSATPGTVRGLHFQGAPFAQAKLIRVTRGAIFDVAVDIRRGSPTYGRWVARELSAEKWNQLLVPAGFAHGFMTIEPDTEVQYKVDAPWSAEHEGAIRWDDPDIAIAWPDTGTKPTLSEKDRAAPLLAGFDSPFAYEN